MEFDSELVMPIEEISRLRRTDAENFRLKNDLETITKKHAETTAQLEKVRAEAAEAFRLAEQTKQTITGFLQEARAQSLVVEAALRSKQEEIIRLKTLNRRLLQLANSEVISTEESTALAHFTELNDAIRAEKASMRDRENWLRTQAPETGTSAGEGTAGAVSGTSLGANAGADSLLPEA